MADSAVAAVEVCPAIGAPVTTGGINNAEFSL